MRKTLLSAIGITLIAFALNASADTEFCSGYSDGYKEGWCYGQFGCIAPITPICPIPRVGEDTYRGGYNRGFIEGQRAKLRR